MEIVLSEYFRSSLIDILRFYADKNPKASEAFYNDLMLKIENIPFMPYRFRRNKHFCDESIRDLIFRGYVIPFKIDDNTIKILAIFGRNLPNYDEF